MQNNSDMEKVDFENVIVYQTFDDQGFPENTAIYRTEDDRYIGVEADDLEAQALDDLAAAQTSEDNISTYAEMMSEIIDNADLGEFDIRVASSENIDYNNVSLRINRERYNVDPATALLYGAIVENAELEVENDALEEDLSNYEELDEIMAIPDPDNWTSLDISYIEATGAELEAEEVFNYEDTVAKPKHQGLMKNVIFEGEDHDLNISVGINAGRVPEAELRSKSRQKVQDGEYANQPFISPSLDTAFQNNQVNPSVVKALDIGTMPLKIAEESGLETEFTFANEGENRGTNFFLDVDGQIVGISRNVLASAIPWKEDTLGVGEDIIERLDEAEEKAVRNQNSSQEHTTPGERDGDRGVQ